MNFESQVLFLFSALGAINGFFLTAYFAFFIKNRSKATFFLSALILAVSVRVTKSVFLIYDPTVSSSFIQVGLAACALIGPFLYLYVKESTAENRTKKWEWLIHVIPIIVIMVLLGYFYPYREFYPLWQRKYLSSHPDAGYFGWVLYSQWFAYIVLAFWMNKKSNRKLFSKEEKLSDKEIWILSIIGGIAIIWLAYFTVSFTSYIVGALSFSFVFYLMLMVWVFNRRKSATFFERQVKYANKKIDPAEAFDISSKLAALFATQDLYKNPNLKMSELASELGLSSSHLSQYLNDNLSKSFSTFINEYRVNAAEEMLKSNHLLTLEAIGQECGFKSNSSFYTAFKKFKGITPGQLKKSLN